MKKKKSKEYNTIKKLKNIFPNHFSITFIMHVISMDHLKWVEKEDDDDSLFVRCRLLKTIMMRKDTKVV